MTPTNPRNFKFCPVCGDRMIEKMVSAEGTKRLVCRGCNFIFYFNPAPAVGVILFQDRKILLVKRKYPPQIGDWTLPAGFMEYEESPEETAIREVKEETNLDIAIENIFAVLHGGYEMQIRVVVIFYTGKILGGKLAPGDDAAEVKFFSLADLPPNIAFSAHSEVLHMLKEKV